MSKAVSRGQALQVASRVGTQVDWDAIDGDFLQREIIELTPEDFGKRFTAFINNGARLIGEPKSILTRSFDPAKFIDKGWTTWKGPVNGDGLSGEEDVDQRSLAISEVELVKFLFQNCLKEGESRISGEEKLRRLKEKSGFIRFGGNVFLGLWEDYQRNKENSALEALYRDKKISFMDFFGQILRSPYGSRRALYLYRDDAGLWLWHYYWLGDDWYADYPSAGCASQS